MSRFTDWKRVKPIAVACAWIGLACSTMAVLRELPAWEQWKAVIDPAKGGATLFLAATVGLVTILRSIRWGLLLKPYQPVAWRKIVPVFGWCFILAALSPFRAGELLRVVWLKRQGGSAVEGSGVILAERMADILVLLFFLWVLSLIVPIPIEFKTGILIAGGAAVLVMAVGRVVFSDFFKEISDLVSLKRLLPLLMGTLVIWCLLLSGFHVYLSAFFPEMPHPGPAAAVMTLVNLSGIVMVTPGNLGAYEMAAVIALACFGYPATESLVAATGLHMVVFTTSMVIGVICRAVLYAQGLRLREFV